MDAIETVKCDCSKGRKIFFITLYNNTFPAHGYMANQQKKWKKSINNFEKLGKVEKMSFYKRTTTCKRYKGDNKRKNTYSSNVDMSKTQLSGASLVGRIRPKWKPGYA